jgi:hypothetical protein
MIKNEKWRVKWVKNKIQDRGAAIVKKVMSVVVKVLVVAVAVPMEKGEQVAVAAERAERNKDYSWNFCITHML